MTSTVWRMTSIVVTVVLIAYAGSAAAHGRHHHRHSSSGWWIGTAVLGTGAALALTQASRYGYGGVMYTPPGQPYMAPVPQVPAPNLHVYAYPMSDQSDELQQQDRQACQRWAMNQSGLDPDNITEYTTGASVESYTRSLGACFKGRGYSIN